MHLPFLLAFLACMVPTGANTQYSADASSCQIYGDAEVYGLGIRLSYYLQWAAVAVGGSLAPSSAARTRAAGNIMSMSVLVASIHGAVAENSLMAVEWYIAQLLTFWLLLLNLPVSRAGAQQARGSLLITLCNYAVILSFPVYLYFGAATLGTRDGCEPYIWLFQPISALSTPWLIACRVFAVIFALCAVLCVVAAVSLFTARKSGTQSASTGLESAVEKADWTDSRPHQRQHTGCGVVLHIAFGAIVISLVEMTIKSNDMIFIGGDLTNGSQLTPLMLGLFSLVSALWEIVFKSGDTQATGTDTVR